MENSIKFCLEDILKKKQELDYSSQQTIQSIYDIASESRRVADYAQNAHQELKNLDAEFESQTGLLKQDIVFLFFATAIQSLRWILSPELGDKINENSRFEHDDKNIKDEIKEKSNSFKKKHTDSNGKLNVIQSEKGYKTWTEILYNGAPYDVTRGSPDIGVNMEGKYHRYKTLGHDPILGWIFGTANFITDTLTLNSTMSYRIKGKKFTNEVVTIMQLFYESIDSIREDKLRLPAAIFAQGVHLASDKYTKLGLPIPMLGIFSESFAGELYRSQYDSLCLVKDLKKIGQSTAIVMIINMIIGLVHGLFYDEARDGQRKLYEVRTKKILTYSNLLASSSNVLYVSISASLGNVDAVKKLDIGGIIVTLYRIMNDSSFIQQVKEEFILGNFVAKIHDENGKYMFK